MTGNKFFNLRWVVAGVFFDSTEYGSNGKMGCGKIWEEDVTAASCFSERM